MLFYVITAESLEVGMDEQSKITMVAGADGKVGSSSEIPGSGILSHNIILPMAYGNC